MNEQIKELAFQAGFIGESMYPILGTTQEQALDNFAELIIKDVIKSVDSYDFKIDPDDLICELKQRYLQRSSLKNSDVLREIDIMTENRKMKAYLVFLNGQEVDTVFYTGHTSEEVKKSLVNHDGYNPNIRVIPEEFYESLDEYEKKLLISA